MEVSTYRCDICGKTAQGVSYSSPRGWFNITCNTKDKDSFWYEGRDVCNECASCPMMLLNQRCAAIPDDG